MTGRLIVEHFCNFRFFMVIGVKQHKMECLHSVIVFVTHFFNFTDCLAEVQDTLE